MNRCLGYSILFSLLTSLSIYSSTPQEIAEHYISQEICFQAENAGEVYLIWGIDDWQQTPKNTWGPNTFLSESLLHTKLTASGTEFTGQINVPANSKIEYLFYISRFADGTLAERYQHKNPQKDNYEVNASEKNKIYVREQTPTPRRLALEQKEATQTDWLAYLLLSFLCLMGLYRWRRRTPCLNGHSNEYFLKILGGFFSAYTLHLVTRLHISGKSLRQGTLKDLGLGYDDWRYLMIVTAFFALIGLIFKQGKTQRRLHRIYLFILLISVSIAVINVQIVAELGRAFNYRWLYYSGFLSTPEAHTAMTSNLSPLLAIHLTAYSMALYLLSNGLFQLFTRIQNKTAANPLITLLVVTISLLGFGFIQPPKDRPIGQIENAPLAFIRSVIQRPTNESIYKMPLPANARFISQTPTSELPETFPIKNVILIVLESTGAQYLDLYGAGYGITPNLNQIAKEARLFEHIYAAAPSTNKTLFALLCSTYPLISYTSVSQEMPQIPLPSLSQSFKAAGYKTAFITTSDIRFQRSDELLASRGFDLIKDYRTIHSANHFEIYGHTEDFGAGADDTALFSEFAHWLETSPQAPFFSILWSNQGHYPYFYNGKERDFKVSNLKLNRYLNTIAHNDAVIGRLVDYLKIHQLYEDTLIVVMGDHGEAFMQHGQSGHATHIYEENVHIPMLLVNPRLFKGERISQIGSVLDVAPTLLGLTDLPIPESWQGESLLDQHRINRAYFFALWSDYLFGIRQGDYKAIFNETTQDIELYDLSTDPAERRNLSEQLPDLAKELKIEIAAWVQYQIEYMKQFTSAPDKSNTNNLP